MFKDKQFVETPRVDARGQRLSRKAGRQKLQEFYDLAGLDSEKRSAAEEPNTPNLEDAEEQEEESAVEDEEDDSEEADEDHQSSSAWKVTQEDVPKGDATRRLAVMGCDWDHVAAGDLMVMFRTYLSTARSKSQAGNVTRISVYPSDYGLQRAEREAVEGPLIADEMPNSSFDDDNQEAQQEALRRYQMDRTKYFWALVECDSESTAAWLYDEMDGIEADGICPATLDLRFVPEELVPPHEATSVATEIPKKFSGPAMLRSATGHTKVKCTWDEAPPQRRKDLMKKRFSAAELADMDLRDYLASSSDESETKGAAQELKALIANSDSEGGAGGSNSETESKPTAGNMEATFSVKATRLEEELAERAQKQGGRGVHTLESEQPQSAWQKYLEKRKEKRREKRLKVKEERAKLKETIAQETGKATKKGQPSVDDSRESGDLELLLEPEMERSERSRSFNLRGPQRQAHDHGLKDAGGAFQMDVHDRRLEKVLSSADFEIDPTNPEFRKSQGMSALLQEKRKRKSAKSTKAPLKQTESKASKEPPSESMESMASGSLQIFAQTKRAAAFNQAEVAPNAGLQRKKPRRKKAKL